MDGRLNSQFQFNPSSMNPPQIQSAENNSRRYVNPIPHFDINNNFDRFHGNNNIPMVPIGDRQAIMEYRNRVNYTDVGDPLRNLQLPPPPPPSQPWPPQFQNPSPNPNPNPNPNTYLRPNFIREEPYNPASKRPRSEDVDFAQRRPRMDVNEFLRPQFRLSPPRSPGRLPFCSLPWDHDNHYRPPHHGFVDAHEPRIQRRDPNEDIRKSDGFGRVAELVPHSGGILPLQRRENPPQGPLPAAFGDLREYLHSSSRQARQGPSSGLEGRIGPSPPSGLEGRFSWNSHSPHDARMGQSEQVSTMEGSRRVPCAYDGQVGPSAHSPPEGRPSAHSPLEGRPSMHTPLEGRPNMHSPFEGRPSVHSPLEGRISGSALEGRVGTGAHSSLEGRPNMHSPLDGRISGSALDSRVGASAPSSLEGRIGPGLNPSLEGRIGPSLNLKDKWIEDPKNNAQVTVMGNLTEAASRGESKQKSVTEVKKFSIPDDRGKRKRKATQALNVLSSPEGRQESSSTSVSVSFKANGMVAQETMTSCPSDAQIDSPKLKNVKHRGGSAREQRSNEVIQIKTTKCIPVVSPKNRALQTKKPLSANSRQLSVVSESSSQARQSRSREVSPDSYVEEIGDKIILSTGESKDKSVASANQLLLESRGNATLISTKGHWNSNNTKAGVTGNLLVTTLNATAPNVRISVATTQNVSVPATKRLNTATENVSTSSVRTSVATTEAVKRLVTITENINPSGVKTSDETTENVNATSAKTSAPASENATPNVTILAAAKEAESLNIKTIVAASENATSSHIKTTAAGSENVTPSTVKPTGAASAASSVKTLVDAADHSDAPSAKDESLNTLKIDSAELPTTGSTVTVSLLSKRKSVEMANDAEKQQKKKKESELQTPTKATQIVHTDMKPVLLKESHNIRQNEKSGTLGSTGSRETSGPLTSKDSVKDQKILQKEFGTTPKNPFINPTQSRSDGNAKNKRSRTWHRADKTGTASIENEQSNKKPQSTYVRKGHSLVRAPSSVGLTGTSLDLSSGLNTSMPEKKIKPWSKPVAKWENFQNGNKVAALSKKDLVPVSGGLGVMSLNMASNKGGQHLVNKSNSPSLSTPQASQSTAHVLRPPPLSTCAALPKSSIGLKAVMSDSVSQPSIKINAEKSPSNSLNKDSEIQKEKMPVKTSFRALKKVNEAEATNTPGAAKEQRVEILDKEKRIPPTGISLKTVQPLNHSLSDRKVNAEGEGAEATKVTYVKRKTNQLVASLTSKSSVSVVPTSESSMSQMNHLGQDHYYKRTKNQILRSSSPHNGSLTTGAETKESSISASKSQQPMQFHTAKQGRGNLKSLLDYNRGSALSLISWKLEKYRKRNTVYTKSSNGFSLRRSGILSLGGSNLKWSKSIDQKLKEANEKATKEMVAMEKQRREEKSISKTFSISEKVKAIRRLGKLNQETKLGTSKLQGSRGRLNRAGLLRYKIDQSKQSLQKIGDVEKLGDTALSDGQCHGAARVTTKGLSEFGNQYLRVGNGIKLIRDPKSINRALATENVRWSWQTVRSRLAKKQQYCLFYTRFGKCNKEEGKCKYIHDREKVAVCTKFLKGVCSNQNCLLTHKIIPKRMEDCSYFLQGFCTNEKCPYKHVNVNPKASVCEGFLKGYCSDGDKCNKKHTYICSQFAKTGECKDRPNCKLRHLKKKEKQKVSRKNKTASGNKKRYFIAGQSASALASLYAQQEALEKSIATTDNLEFISIDASVEETEAHDLLRGILDPMKTSEPQPFYGLELFVEHCLSLTRHVDLSPDVAKMLPKNSLLSESEWRAIGVQQSRGWVHYVIHHPETVNGRENVH